MRRWQAGRCSPMLCRCIRERSTFVLFLLVCFCISLCYSQRARIASSANNTRKTSEVKARTGQSQLWLSESPQNASIFPGDSHEMSCQTEESDVLIQWFRGDVLIQNSTPGIRVLRANATLWIQSMSASLAGEYKCVVTSKQDKVAVRAWISLARLSPGCNSALKKAPQNGMRLALGDFATLRCWNGHGAETDWEKDGLPVDSDDRVQAIEHGHLVITEALPEDSGMYTCIVKNGNCQRRTSFWVEVYTPVDTKDVCGRPRISVMEQKTSHSDLARIVGGNDVDPREIPWQAMIWKIDLDSLWCGASLLTEKWVITAAQCVMEGYKRLDPWSLKVRLGKLYRNGTEATEINATVDDVVVHPRYNHSSYDYDLALIRLSNPVAYTEQILPICLGGPDFARKFFSHELTMGTVSGWGYVGPSQTANPSLLKKLKLPIQNDSICRNSSAFPVTQNMFCAGYAQEVLGDACQGDAGGPFTVESEGRSYLVGIVSWGEGCAQSNKYAWFTKVANFIPWIEGHTSS